jgi:hypothetical protein
VKILAKEKKSVSEWAAFLIGVGIGMMIQHGAWLWDVKRGLWRRG